MDKTFKFKFVNEITGVFVLLAIVFLVAGIFFAGRAQGLFEPKFHLLAVFQAEDGTYGLKKGSEVRIRDTVAGSVSEIRPLDEGTIQATFELKSSFHNFVRTNSVAVIKKALVVAGDSFVDISIGKREFPLIASGGIIACVPDQDITQQALKVLAEIREKALPAIDKVNALLDEMPALASQARETLRESEELLSDEVPALLIQAQDTALAARILIEGLQRHWILRKYVEKPELGPLLAPSLPAFEIPNQNGGE